ncbi:stage II sporulation protein M [Verrucomicrobiaceae bacterium R5-34]|uniref:Stage II sporulation protein M n=1 Tax=Oceaniferula flava TaxID=2800421 RepID=A0AAE2SFH3_9BACT|nr:stage II sporulation protein M [Oceaniferula flavus]MBK1830682.1 stage II sporulation protein M [Verrucomicrobiaceae bacterium R5-34]MBK1855939.1 stage II sporulation protein M [Oceaniferula flavus]MBM1137246.1 stage II sporulation protein M [Oceaniferula flavus]
MQGKEFEEKNAERWAEYDQTLSRLEKKRDPSIDVSTLPTRFREICTDLALARHRMYGMPMNEHLNELVIRGHKMIHRRAGGTWEMLLRFVAVDFPVAVRKEWRLLIVATLSFVLPLIGVALAGFYWPDFSWIQAVLGPQMMQQLDMMYGSSDDQISNLRDEYGSNFMMFCHYIWNNIGIDFRIYAGGILACLGSLFFLIYNGVFFGAVIAYIHTACSTKAFYTFVAGHSSFELIAMVIAGMAGLRIGLGLLHPGRKTRRKSLMDAGKKSLPLILGAALMTFVAAAIEGFWSAQALPEMLKYSVGIALWFVCVLYLALAGRGARQSSSAVFGKKSIEGGQGAA